jgi:hypothetical protein
VPPTPPAPPVPPNPPVNNAQFNQVPPNQQYGNVPPANNNPIDSLTKNPKFMETVKVVAIYGAIFSIINYLIGYVSNSIFLTKYYGAFKLSIPFSALFSFAISAAIGGIIGGVLFYFLYNPIKNFVKGSSFLSKYIHDMFTLFWKPTLTFTVIAFVFALLPILATIFISPKIFLSIIISSVVQLVLFYIYAKKLSEKLEKYYPW